VCTVCKLDILDPVLPETEEELEVHESFLEFMIEIGLDTTLDPGALFRIPGYPD
jgi:hypothetical protein